MEKAEVPILEMDNGTGRIRHCSKHNLRLLDSKMSWIAESIGACECVA